MEFVTDVGSHKCAHDICQCQIPAAEEYCSGYCAESEDFEEVESQCACEHVACKAVEIAEVTDV